MRGWESRLNSHKFGSCLIAELQVVLKVPSHLRNSSTTIPQNENLALQFPSFGLNLFLKGQTISYYASKFLCCQAKLQQGSRIVNHQLQAGSILS